MKPWPIPHSNRPISRSRSCWLTLAAAGLGCDGCRVRLSCGCDIVQDVPTGQYAHGIREAAMAAAQRSGYLDATAWPDASTRRDGCPDRRGERRRR
jgi:hypothetical protein